MGRLCICRFASAIRLFICPKLIERFVEFSATRGRTFVGPPTTIGVCDGLGAGVAGRTGFGTELVMTTRVVGAGGFSNDVVWAGVEKAAAVKTRSAQKGIFFITQFSGELFG